MKKVLLIEDNQIAQKVALLNLKAQHCSVDIVETGAQALAALSDQTYDLILMDIGLPDVDGYLLTEQIRELVGRSTVIVGLSAHNGKVHESRCIEVGMNQVIPKPLTPDIVRSLLSELEVLSSC